MIELNNINLKGGNKILLKNGHFSANQGELTLICGQSGCGKSTLLYEIGLLTFNKDIDYYISDINVRGLSHYEILNLKKYEIGYVFQNSDLFDDESVSYNILHFASLVNRKIGEEEMLEYLNLLQLRVSLNQKIRTLSGGERQRIAVICALIKDSHILVLDEITSALDVDNEEKILKILKDIAIKKNIIVIMASHSGIAKEYADKIYLIKDKNLECIKKSDTKDVKKELVLNNNLKLSFSQYFQYTKSYFRRYFFLNILLIFALTCGLAFISFLDYYQQYYEATVLKEVNELSYNELWIYDGDTTLKENLKLKEEILTLLPNIEIYPYFKANCILNDTMIEVIPFYLNERNGSLLLYESNKDTGVFISSTISDNYNVHLNNQLVNIQGKFERGVRIYDSSYEFVGMGEEQALNYAFDIQYNGYIIRTKDFNELIEIYELLSKKTDYNIDASMQDITVLESYIHEASESMNKYYIGSFLFVSLLFSLFYILYYSSRKIEIAYLKVNGYTHLQLSVILALENTIRYIIGTIISVIVTIIIKLFIFKMDVMMIDIIIATAVLSLFFIFIPFIFSWIYIYRLKPIKVYRS